MKKLLVVVVTFLFLVFPNNLCDDFTSSEVKGNYSNQDKNKVLFTAKKSNDLPAWWENAERMYMLNDDRIVEYENVEFIGGFEPNIGEVFFIDGKEISFKDNQIKISRKNNLISKSFTSGDYKVVMDWDENMTTGAYSEGTISLYYKGKLQNKTIYFESGW